MSRCKKCNVMIRMGAGYMACPLCGQVMGAEEQGSGHKESQKQWNEYPDIRKETRMLTKIVNCYVILSILVEAALIYINYDRSPDFWWSLICGGAMIYLYVTLKYSIIHDTGYLIKILIQTVGAILLAVWIDSIVGFKGWSIDYVMPSAIILVDAAILILMLVNSMNWQSYILFQVFMTALSMVSMGLYLGRLIRHPFLTYVAVALSVLIFAGTLAFGDRRAKSELKRRFHI